MCISCLKLLSFAELLLLLLILSLSLSFVSKNMNELSSLTSCFEDLNGAVLHSQDFSGFIIALFICGVSHFSYRFNDLNGYILLNYERSSFLDANYTSG